jgi:NADH:quinone reductase (non-electrogenic)
LWRGIYLSKLPGLQKKVRVAIDWTLDLLFSKDIVQLPTVRSRTMSEVEKETELMSGSVPGLGPSSIGKREAA